ncbi:hypothetical protein PVBG_05851 [Plasmodium vivax Brazil I]|uniref:PIR Superfamily Protein n=1 Tax=Plasmodium vivax (strain Brazil I) TaxID=1033975 RepID=A0A0J9T0W3_PLAV1|nr:hypothetical protein PVBG_05851 [Plasmodium vivax Brazil I]
MECYNTMISVQTSESEGIDVCKKHIEQINEKIFEKFKNLDSLYDILYKFVNSQEEGHSIKCHLGKNCSEQYSEHIKLCHPVSHIGFCNALDKFKDTYNMHMKDGTTCENVPGYLYSPFGRDGRPIIFILLITIFAMTIIIFTVYKVNIIYL